jgi:hypothetical protein
MPLEKQVVILHQQRVHGVLQYRIKLEENIMKIKLLNKTILNVKSIDDLKILLINTKMLI